MRKTIINNGLVLNEYPDGLLFGTDALLLASYAQGSSKRKGCDLGCGSGVVAMLMLSSHYASKMYSVDIQKKYADLTSLNFHENGFDEIGQALHCDVRNIRDKMQAGCCDFVVTNPPYMTQNCGKPNMGEEKQIARHEVHGDIFDFCNAASWCLRSGGNFYVVYRPERLAVLFKAMQDARITPKRLKPILPFPQERPSLILCEGKKDASDGLIFEAPLCIYNDKEHKAYSDEMRSVLKSLKITK